MLIHLRLSMLIWMRDKMVEAIDIVPYGYADTLQGQAEYGQ